MYSQTSALRPLLGAFVLACLGMASPVQAIDVTPQFTGQYNDQTCSYSGGTMTATYVNSAGYGGCANADTSIVPLGFSSGDQLVITGKAAPTSGQTCTSADVYVTFEANAYPNNSPNFVSPTVTLTTTSSTQTVALASGQAATQAYNSVIFNINGATSNNCTIEISSLTITHSGVTTPGPAKPTKGSNDVEGVTFGGFEGAQNSGNDYTVDYSASGTQSYAGWSKTNAAGTWRFPSGGQLYFTADPDVANKIKFVFEKAAYPDVTPKFDTGWITLDVDAKHYLVDLPAQPSGNSYASFLMYLESSGTVNLTNVGVYGIEPLTDCPATDKYVFDGIFGGSEVIGHKVETGDCSAPPKYVVKTGSESWAGFADSVRKESNYPMYFTEGGTLRFKGKGSNKVKFVWQKEAFPNNLPEFASEEIQLTSTATEYTVEIPGDGANTYNNFLMYIIGNNTSSDPVEVWDVEVISRGAPISNPNVGSGVYDGNDPDAVPALPLGGILGLICGLILLVWRRK